MSRGLPARPASRALRVFWRREHVPKPPTWCGEAKGRRHKKISSGAAVFSQGTDKGAIRPA